jgi:pyrroline-5-carboxylate reductase
MDSISTAFIGGGAMGEAMLAAVLQKGLARPQDVRVSDVKPERRQLLKETYGVVVTDDNVSAVAQADVIVLAIKPQNLAEALPGLKGRLKAEQLVLSIIAGAKIDTLCQGLDHHPVVRVMPNTPAQVGEGVSVWTATREVTGRQKEQARAILASMGREIYMEDEKYLDKATAISGSGPAYFFLFIEALVDAAEEIGLPREVAGEMVLQTMLGSGHLLQKSGGSPAELRRMVTSPGGTTSAALQEFESGNLKDLVHRAVIAAYRRAQELGN